MKAHDDVTADGLASSADKIALLGLSVKGFRTTR